MVATRFAVATHILLLLAHAERRRAVPGNVVAPVTSTRLANSIHTNPVVVRRITGKLARAGLIRVHRGPGGAELARPPAEITLDDVWRAVHGEPAPPLVPLHARQPARRPEAVSVHDLLAESFGRAERSFRQALRQTTLEELVERLAVERA